MIKNTIVYFSISLVSAGVGILINPALARALSAHDYALIGYFSALQLILLPIISLNLHAFYQKEYSALTCASEKNNLYASIWLFQTIFGIVGTIIFSLFVAAYLHLSKIDYNFFPIGAYTFFTTYFLLFYSLHLTMLRYSNNIKGYIYYSFGYIVLSTSLILILVVFMEEGAEGKQVAGLIAASIMAIIIYYRKPKLANFNTELIKKGIKYCIPLTLSGLLWFLIVGVDKIILAEYGHSDQFGLYVVAGQMCMYMMIFYSSISSAIEPILYRLIHKGEMIKAVKVSICSLLGIALANCVFIFYSKPIISILTGGVYVDASKYAEIIAIQNITLSMYYFVLKFYTALGFTKEEFGVRIIGVIVSYGIYVYAIDQYRYIGAAWGQVLVTLWVGLLSICMLILIVRRKKIV